jgi:hypothetical protein
MTPEASEEISSAERATAWHIPISIEDLTLGQTYASLKQVGLRRERIAFVVQLVENSRFDLPLIDIFPAATDLEQYDCLHIFLGRGRHAISDPPATRGTSAAGRFTLPRRSASPAAAGR